MSLTTCWKCLKYIVMLINLIFWLAGIAILALALWIYFDSTRLMQVIEDHQSYFTALYILIGAGCVMTVVGFLGCCGALKESQCMLATFFVFLLLILIAQVGAGVYGYLNIDKLKDVTEDQMKKTMQESYTKETRIRDVVDQLQSRLKCCGAEGPEDWEKSAYNKYKPKDTQLGALASQVLGAYKVPHSCCKNIACKKIEAIEIGGASAVLGMIYNDGCVDALLGFMKKNMVYVVIVVAGVVLVEILGMIFSILLCCAVRRVDDMKH